MQSRMFGAPSPSSSSTEPYTPIKFNRPTSPFHIYKPQVSSVMSIAHRISGVGLTVLVYVFGVFVSIVVPFIR